MPYFHEDCPDKAKHTPAPRGYMEWHDWATKMSKTHKQLQCPTCNKWSIWIPKKRRTKAA